MNASFPLTRARRRGIVLVLVLGMLALLALIGVTFATFAGQSLINGRNFVQGVSRPQSEALMDYALSQLINDSNNPLSAIRGHSLLRDMYGNDSVFRGANPPANPAVETGGLLTQVVIGTTFQSLHFTGYVPHPQPASPGGTPFFNQLQYFTNIPIAGQYYGLDFTRWIIRFPTAGVPQTFEVLEDDASDTTAGVHKFTLSANLVNPTNDPTYPDGGAMGPMSSADWTAFIYANPNLGAAVDTTAAPPYVKKGFSKLAPELNTVSTGATPTDSQLSASAPSNAFVLDGRYMRAFNGPGLTRPVPPTDSTGTIQINAYPYNLAAYANFRLNAFNPSAIADPDAIGMDEDYDACDLENWFLAIQSADGQVMIPSFHRPGILMPGDWSLAADNTSYLNVARRSKILRPRQIDNSPLFPSDPSTLDPTGKLTYDVDNDGDGVSDSVWLDLGYPVQRDPNGKLYKPLFSFMVLGLNGRLPLNTVGNLQARAIGDETSSPPSGLASSTQVPVPGKYTIGGPGTPFYNVYSAAAYYDSPLWDHASHLGYSVNEINPKFALQNAPSNVYSVNSAGFKASPYGFAYSQMDNVGVSVALTQLRNILSGTVPGGPLNGDSNLVFVDGQAFTTGSIAYGSPGFYGFPNNVADGYDTATTDNTTKTTYVQAAGTRVPGRWGEPEGIPTRLGFPTAATFDPSTPMYWYQNPVRAGRSVYSTGSTNDVMDDDLDSTDLYLASQFEIPTVTPNTFSLVQTVTGSSDQYTIPLNMTYTGNQQFTRNYPEFVDAFDNAGQMRLASERARRYVTPQDPAGVGRVVSFMTRPLNDADYGLGSDNKGRSSFFRYFRPAGMPQEVRYPYPHPTGTTFPYAYTTSSGLGQQYLMPVLVPAGWSSNPTPLTKSDIHNNRLHGFQSMLTPAINDNAPPQVVPTMGAMPYDNSFDYSAGTNSIPIGDFGYVKATTPANNPILLAPTINPTVNTYLKTHVNSENGPNLGATGYGTIYPIPYGAPYGITNNQPQNAPVVNGYLDGSLNKDEADEMNLYVNNRYDMPYGPSDLEWLYRKQDVDGATLSSRLSQLAPISFLNPADGLTRRRLFSTDAFDLTGFVYANDNPIPYAGAAYVGNTINGVTLSASTDHDFTYNSRFGHNASPSLEAMNQVPSLNIFSHYANFITTEFLPNVTLPAQAVYGTNLAPNTHYLNTINSYIPNSAFVGSAQILPAQIDPSKPNSATAPLATFTTNAHTNAVVDPYTNLIVPAGGISAGIPQSMVQVQTPPLAHRDRKINLNFPLPISNEPAESIRQKWCRETYQMLKAILPPASVDTPEELAALSQYVVNIIDFRDPDCTMTRFVNTDLEVTDVLTKQAPNNLLIANVYDPTWTVSPPGVKFATSTIPDGHFPYDPSIYHPDTVTSFLVQHGMEYNPIALNEVMAYQGQNAAGTTPNYQAMFIELVNTLTEEQNNAGTKRNSSAISLEGWDLILTPDNYGWGRPDPISGDVPQVALPPVTPNSRTGDPTMAPVTTPPASSQYPYAKSSDTNLQQLQMAVQQYTFTNASLPANNPIIKGIDGASKPDYFVVGDYRTPSGLTYVSQPATTVEGANPNVQDTAIDLRLPVSFTIPIPTAGLARYYWLYLRRPANPFDVAMPNQVRPNKEMVVVDAIRFPVIDVGTAAVPNAIYSAQRLQPYRGGHLLPVNTSPSIPGPVITALPASGPAGGVTTICPPSPAYAYGFSEQMAAPVVSTTNVAPLPSFFDTIGKANNPIDTNWSNLPFHDRDFSSVAELLLVPGCPPGLFTKQFVEEAYPGNIFSNTGGTVAATGTDNSSFTPRITAPVGTINPSLVGRKDFSLLATLPPNCTFPYLPDNFYYTAASVAPPVLSSGTYDAGYTHLTTEIGGWTGNGWHKMLEFFEVPSSANGATGAAEGGVNYDWARNDLRPGQLNLNLIIDEEVFAGLFDDPRLNENLAYLSSSIPYVVTQIDGNGYPVSDSTGNILGRQLIFDHVSSNAGPLPTPGALSSAQTGRGYVYRDANQANYDTTRPGGYPYYQQVHGLKAAFSDFLKLRHGGSGYLFAYGAGPTGSGDFTASLAVPATTQPIAAERPYRSLSYPDINYTIMRPASLPPSIVDPNNTPVHFPGTPTPLDPKLAGQFIYGVQTGAPYVLLNPPWAPMNNATNAGGTANDFPYAQDPGIKNPYLSTQYVNIKATGNPAPSVPATPPNAPPVYSPTGPSGTNLVAPPFAVEPSPSKIIPAAPFPPPIPPTPTRRLIQVPDYSPAQAAAATGQTSNASLLGQQDLAYSFTITTEQHKIPLGTLPTASQLARRFPVNQPTTTALVPMTDNTVASPNPAPPVNLALPTPPSLVPEQRLKFGPDNYNPNNAITANNLLGAKWTASASGTDLRQHPLYRTEFLQKAMNQTTVRTHQFAVWITVGFFEVTATGTPELGIPDVLGQELGYTAGKNVRYRSFFTIDRTRATGFNPYNPGNFRDCVTYRRRIE